MSDLTQTEKDLRRYAQRKLTIAMKDISESFRIAGIGHHAVPCLGVELLKAAAAFCLVCGVSRKEFTKCAGEHYDKQQRVAECDYRNNAH